MLESVSGVLLLLFLSWLGFVTAREMWRKSREAWKNGAIHSRTGRQGSWNDGAVTGWYYIAGGGRIEQKIGKEDGDEEEIDVKDTCCVQ